MSTRSSERVSEIAWKRKADEIRSKLIPKLLRLDDFEFLDKKLTAEMGCQFWSIVEKIMYVDPNELEMALNALSRRNQNDRVLWFHRYTNETGAIVVTLSTFLYQMESLRAEFGPDILVAGLSFEYGLCFEEGESGSYLRWWG